MKYYVINDCLINMDEITHMVYEKDKEMLRVCFKNGSCMYCVNVGDDIFVQMQEAFKGD